jgi:hypothetical protein
MTSCLAGWSEGFFSITRTADELSVVCPEELVPEGVKVERGWRTLRVAGLPEPRKESQAAPWGRSMPRRIGRHTSRAWLVTRMTAGP